MGLTFWLIILTARVQRATWQRIDYPRVNVFMFQRSFSWEDEDVFPITLIETVLHSETGVLLLTLGYVLLLHHMRC